MSRPRPRWSPPVEPEKPSVPYRKGFQFTASRVQAPPPFLGRYAKVPTGPFLEFLDKHRCVSREFLHSTTLTDYCLATASYPLPCTELGETASFEVLEELTVGDGGGRGRGSQVITCARHGTNDVLVAKVYDPLYYPFADDDFPYMPNNVILRAESDFTLESAAYSQLDGKLGGSLIPKFYGSWLLWLPLKDVRGPVGFTLMELVKGVPLNALDPKHYTPQERLRVIALSMEAALEIRFAGVMHDDIAPRNIICSGKDFSAPDFSIRVIDFNFVTVFPLLGLRPPCDSEPLPESPIEWFWNSRPPDMRDWLPDGWRKGDEGRRLWNQWLKETWAGTTRFKPAPEHLLNAE